MGTPGSQKKKPAGPQLCCNAWLTVNGADFQRGGPHLERFLARHVGASNKDRQHVRLRPDRRSAQKLPRRYVHPRRQCRTRPKRRHEGQHSCTNLLLHVHTKTEHHAPTGSGCEPIIIPVRVQPKHRMEKVTQWNAVQGTADGMG